MDDDTLQFRDGYQPQSFNDSSRCVPKPGVRFQTRHATSDVDFRIEHDRVCYPETDNTRRKRRTKPVNYPSCQAQSVHQNSMDSHFDDHHELTNPHKFEASLTQRLDHTTCKVASSHVKNRSSQHQQQQQHQQLGNPSSPRIPSTHQKSKYHRPGTSLTRNNPNNPISHRHTRKHENIEPCECTRIESPHRTVVISDATPEDTDFQTSRDHNHAGNTCKSSSFCWHSPPGEPHFEPEMNLWPRNRHREYTESKRRHSGQGESVYDACRDSKPDVWKETGSSLDKDVRQQCERDQQELKDLYEDLGEFTKRKSSGWVTRDAHHGQEYTWDYSKQRRQDKDEEEESQDLLQSLNQLVGKVLVQRKEKVARVATCICPECSVTRSKTTKEQIQSRNRSSKLDGRKAYHSVGTNGRNVAASQKPEPERTLDEELADIRLDSSKPNDEKDEDEDDDETKDVEYLSETEEEARELAGEDAAFEHIRQRQPTKNSVSHKRHGDNWNSRISSKCERTGRDVTADADEKIYRQTDCGTKEVDENRERRKGKRDKEVIICDRELSRQHRVVTSEGERKESKKSYTRGRSLEKDDGVDKAYEEFENCYGVSGIHGAGDLELETSKTKTCIDEMIDSGLSREVKRGSGVTIRDTAKNLQCETDGSDTGPLKRGTSDETNKIIHPDGSCPEGRQTDSKLFRTSRDDCICKTLAEIVADYRDPRECVRKLKDCRWLFLNHMQNDLEKLYGLEKLLDSCSVDERPSSATFATGFNLEVKDSKNIVEKTDKAKESTTQMRL